MVKTKESAWRELWSIFFSKSWPMWIGGIVLAILSLLLLMIKLPWGGTGTYLNWGRNLYSFLDIIHYDEGVSSTIADPYGLLGLMTLLGAFAGALLSKEFAIRIPPPGELIKGFIGGALMALGATMGIGCTIGGFLSGWSALSGGAVFLAIGFSIGAFLALRYLIWEMEKFPKFGSGKSFTLLAAKEKSGIWQPILGIILVLFLLIGGSILFHADNRVTWIVIIGLFLGIICQRSRFCVTRAFREPFMTGDATAPVAIMAFLAVGIFGGTVIKYMGIGSANTAVYPHFWLRALIGGIIFGLGMTVAGGCAVGTLWRAGEGQVKLWASVLGWVLMVPISKKFIAPGFANFLPDWAKQRVFLPNFVGYGGAVVIFLVIIVLWYVFVKWNERTGKFSQI